MTSEPTINIALKFPGWTEDELEEVLYHYDNTTYPIIEYKYESPRTLSADAPNVDKDANAGASPPTDSPTESLEKADSSNDSKDNEVVEKAMEAYINIPIDGDDIHIFEFYAPWCPHCQHFKPTYVKLAKEITKRSINVNVFFHSVSCTLNEDVCNTYNIKGYPTFLAYRGGGRGDGGLKDARKEGETGEEEGKEEGEQEGEKDRNNNNGNDDSILSLVGNTTLRGTELEFDDNLNRNIDILAATMKFDLASIPREYSRSESKYSNSEDQRRYEAQKLERSHEVADEKLELLEYSATKNEIYHDAILSLTYILRTGIYQRSSSDSGELNDHKDISALEDFLQLVHWASPTSWLMRKTLIKDLIQNFDSAVVQGKRHLVDIVERHSPVEKKNDDHNDNDNDNLLWGYIDAKHIKQNQSLSKRRHTVNHHDHDVTGGKNHKKEDHTQHKNIDQKKWTKACFHGPTSRGFTCGLWELFHILTIGSGMTQNQLYGFQHGYKISQRDVAETIRNFIARFFHCDVCRTNFITMYDNCGHDHCNRLSDDVLPFLSSSKGHGGNGNYGQNEVVMWLWEVHNAVNLRLLKEKAQRERRKFTKSEELASKFPTRNSCPSCWLDQDMNEWDSTEVFNFLKGHYWYDKTKILPSPTYYGKQMHGDMSMEGQPLSTLGLLFVVVPFFLLGFLFLRSCLLKNGFSSLYSFRQSKNKFF